jgi:CHASE3 domain sensor protein
VSAGGAEAQAPGAPAPHPPDPDRGRLSRISVGRLLAVSAGALLVVAIAGIVFSYLAASRLDDRRENLVDRLGPALNSALALENAFVNQETGIRGFALTGEEQFLEPYRAGLAAEQRAYAELTGYSARIGRVIARDLATVRQRAQEWRSGYVQGVIERGPNDPVTASPASSLRGKERFDAIRAALDRLGADLQAERDTARRGLLDAAEILKLALILIGMMIVAAIIGAAVLLARFVSTPLADLGRQARRVSSGDFDAPLEPSGPRELVAVGEDIEAMR